MVFSSVQLEISAMMSHDLSSLTLLWLQGCVILSVLCDFNIFARSFAALFNHRLAGMITLDQNIRLCFGPWTVFFNILIAFLHTDPQSWADAFRSSPSLVGVVYVYDDLRKRGLEFPMTDLDALSPIHTPNRVRLPTKGK